MSTYEERTRQAFQEVHVPEQVKQSTLDLIGAQRSDEGQQVGAEMPAASTDASPRRTSRMHLVTRFCVAAACLALVLVVAGGAKVYFEPTAYIDIDVNPSIELTVNRFDRVIDATALNEDGQDVLDAVDVKHEKAQEAIEILTASEAFEPYVQADSYVSVSVVSEDEQQGAALTSQGQQVVDGLACAGCCQSVDAETWEAAQSAHMGVGRYLAAQKLMELDDGVTLDECANMTMRELRDRIAELGGSLDIAGGCKNDAGQGQHQGQHQRSHGTGANANQS